MTKKSLITPLFLFLIFLSPAMGQTLCEGFLPFEEGLFFEQTHYDAKGKVSSVSSATVQEVKEVDGGYTARIASDLVDGKGKEVSSGEYEIRCADGVFYMDLNNAMNPSMMEAYQNMEVTISGEGLQFPSELAVGQELPSGETKMEVASNGLSIVSFSFASTDRKVEDKETITTSAGAFECFRIRETIEYQAMFLKRSYQIVGWYSKQVGLVKQETFDHKGKLSSTMELTKFGRK